jgi:asparagine synthase (glutamine-hydrolysing)
MCGIFGAISRDRSLPKTLSAMSKLLRHRGPDGEGAVLFSTSGEVFACGGPDTSREVYESDTSFAPVRPLAADGYGDVKLAFGHRRLAIVELSPLGHQPMASADRQIWITYNGEIYNHVELRQELEGLGHRFTSHSDTAVIIEAYRQWGVDCLKRFNGMFAFVLYDRAKDTLFLARDRFGVKPLNLWRNGKSLYFSSEIKAFLACPDFVPMADPELMADYLENGPSEYAVDTLFKGVQRLAAASYIFASPRELVAGSARTVKWWALDPDPSKEPFDERKAATYVETYRALLTSAVDLRLRADVQIGSALSGGLDSSSIVYLIADNLKRQGAADLQETFSSVYQSPNVQRYDESKYIYAIGKLLGVSVNTVEPKAEDVPEEHLKVIWAMDTPPESTLMSSWNTFKLVNQRGIKVTLDGQGADEQLGGYLSYLPHAVAGRSPGQTLSVASTFVGAFPIKFALGSVVMGLSGSIIPSSFFQNRRQRETAQALSYGLNSQLSKDCSSSLANLLHYGDRTSMAFSVESRMPFLDYRLAEFLTRVPESYKIHGGWTKYIARRALEGRLPDDVVWRRDKMGWPIPESVWEKGPLKQWFGEGLADDFPTDDLKLRDIDNRTSKRSSIDARVRAINLRSWHRMYIEGGWKSAHNID